MSDEVFVTPGRYPVRQGNQLELLLDGEAAFERVCGVIEAGAHSIWAAITFMWPDFRFPGGRGRPLDFLNRAAARGTDVRLLFWRPGDETASLRPNAFWGAPEHLELLQRLHPNISIRWDRAASGYCQHQKVWLISPHQGGAVAFVGGLNLNPHSLACPGHAGGGGQNHDLYAQLRGPAVADVQHNFVQRWNGASERQRPDGHRGRRGRADLEYPSTLPAACGAATVQIQRTIHPDQYQQGVPPVGGEAFDAAAGDRDIIMGYTQAIRRARRSIYLEHQYLELPEIVEALHGALERGVEVVALLPAQPETAAHSYATAQGRAFFEARAALAHAPNFTLIGLAGLGAAGQRHWVWIHSKLILIDDSWGSVGSANLHRYSAYGNAELNVTFWDPETARRFRAELLAEHLGQDTAHLDDLAALLTLKHVATANRVKLETGRGDWQGIAVTLDLSRYGVEAVPAPRPPF